MGEPEPAADRTVFQRTRTALSVLAGLLAILGIVLHLTVRDLWPGASIAFYALPRPVIAGLLLLAVAVRPAKHRGIHWVRQAIVGVGLAWAAWGTLELQAVTAPASALRLGFWNCCRGHRGPEAIAQAIVGWDADILGLVEAEEIAADRDVFWKEQLPGYEIRSGQDGMVLGLRGTIHSYRREVLSRHCVAGVFEAEVEQQRFVCVLVDMNSHPGYSRRASLQALAKLLKSLGDRPIIVMGDFNTPDDSAWFAEIRPGFRSAFRSHGQGYAPTWPVPLPVLTLDQVWLNGHVQGFGARHGWTTLSDHRPVFCTVRLR